MTIRETENRKLNDGGLASLDSPGSGARILIVDDDRTLCRLLANWLQRAGHRTAERHDATTALDALRGSLFDALLLDLNLPDRDRFALLSEVRGRYESLPVLVLTADTTVGSAVEAMRLGAHDYLTKPVNRVELEHRLRLALERSQLTRRMAELERQTGSRSYPGLVGSGPAMTRLYGQIDRVVTSEITVLIQGESGSGKELVARAIHQEGSRRQGPFVAVNCAAIPDTLQESELFGHEKGAFTGATGRRAGKFEQADQGTLFLDEIAELSLPAQAKVLRVLQDRTFHRVGSAEELHSDFRLIAATHRDLAQRVKDGLFREDLFFRVAVFDLQVPPLRARTDDLPLLVEHFFEQIRRREKTPDRKRLAPEVARLFALYPWPGNVRELENALERAAVASEHTTVELEHLPPRLAAWPNQSAGKDGTANRRTAGDLEPTRNAASPSGVVHPVVVQTSLVRPEEEATLTEDGEPTRTPQPGDNEAARAEFGEASGAALLNSVGSPLTLDQIEKLAIAAAIRRTGGNLSQVGRELGIGRTTLYRKIKRYELSIEPKEQK